MGTLTKSDVEFNEVLIFRVRQADDTWLWYANVGYQVLSVEGESYHKDIQTELTGDRKTEAKTFLTNLYDDIVAEETA